MRKLILSSVLLMATNVSYADDADKQSERLQVISSFIISPQQIGVAHNPGHFAVEAGLGLGFVPEIDGTVGSKKERTDFSPVIPKPSVSLALPFGLNTFFSYTPPVTVNELTPHVFSSEINWQKALPFGITVQPYVGGSVAKVIAPVTKDGAEDELSFNQVRGGLTLENTEKLYGFSGFLGAGYQIFSTEFLVPADDVTLTGSEQAPHFAAGFKFSEGGFTLAFQQNILLDVVNNFDVSLSYQFGGPKERKVRKAKSRKTRANRSRKRR